MKTMNFKKYGAPRYGAVENCAPKSIRLFRVSLAGGYDEGGACCGKQIFCATSLGYFQIMRADNRAHAALLLRIPNEKLKQRITEYHWRRWSTVLAWCGKATPLFELREFGAVTGKYFDFNDLADFARGEKC